MPPRKKQKTDTGPTPAATASKAFPSPELLTRALAQYGRAISLRSGEHSKSPNALIELDTWLTDRDAGLLGKLVSAQPVTKADMTSLMKWKLSRGKSRPTLLALVASNPEALVEKSTSAALTAVRDAQDDVARALLALPHACLLKGVGPATASALLTLQPSHLLPFMSDEAASFFAPTLGTVKYTEAYYAKFARAMDAEVRRLNAASEGDVRPWDSMSLERALFAICILRKHNEDSVLELNAEPKTPPSPPGSKRRRGDGT